MPRKLILLGRRPGKLIRKGNEGGDKGVRSMTRGEGGRMYIGNRYSNSCI